MTDPLLVETVVLDGMWRVPDDHADHGRRYRIAWFDPPFLPPLGETTQALGICFTGDRLTYYQTRFWARVELEEFRPEHEMTARRLVAPERFRAALFWGAEATAGLILARGLAIERSDHGRAALF